MFPEDFFGEKAVQLCAVIPASLMAELSRESETYNDPMYIIVAGAIDRELERRKMRREATEAAMKGVDTAE